MKRLLPGLFRVLDPVAALLLVPAAWLLRSVRRAGVHRLPLSRSMLMRMGIFPIRDHYYEPQFDFSRPRVPFSSDRHLPGIDWNVSGQLAWLDRFGSLSRELEDLPREEPQPLDYYLDNEAFLSGDAEYWYQLIRVLKPRRIIEIGSGHSTLMAMKAIARNREEDPGYRPEHTAVEPYEAGWLEGRDIRLVRRRVEDLEPAFFAGLGENDILFIDSSHVIRPQGDVLFEFLEVLPSLETGVVVHIHDVFSPRNYPAEWLQQHVRFWNEQYLLEAFLSHNQTWEILGALNYLHHHHYERLSAVAPFLTPDREPGSFYIRKVRPVSLHGSDGPALH